MDKEVVSTEISSSEQTEKRHFAIYPPKNKSKRWHVKTRDNYDYILNNNIAEPALPNIPEKLLTSKDEEYLPNSPMIDKNFVPFGERQLKKNTVPATPRSKLKLK